MIQNDLLECTLQQVSGVHVAPFAPFFQQLKNKFQFTIAPKHIGLNVDVTG